MKVAVECGQKFWRFRSWVPHRYPERCRWRVFLRRFPQGFAIGPLIFFK